MKDLEAQCFIGKCLVNVSNRLSAKDLMLDPFLAMDEYGVLPVSKYVHQKPFMNDEIEIEKLSLGGNPPRTNMSIAGKLNPDDDTIILRVQIADREGNFHHPFQLHFILSINRFMRRKGQKGLFIIGLKVGPLS